MAKIQGTIAVNGNSPDGALDPISDGFEVRLGGREGTPLIVIPPTAEGWVLRKGVPTWMTPKGSLIKAKVVVNVVTGTWSLTLKKTDLPTIPINPIALALSTGTDAGTQSSDWRPVPKRAGTYRIP